MYSSRRVWPAPLLAIRFTLPSKLTAQSRGLKKVQVGVTPFGSLIDFFFKHLAKQKGLNPDKDFALQQIGSDADRFIAIQQGRIPMSMLSHPKYLYAPRPAFKCCGLFSVMRYMRAQVEGIDRFKQEPELGKRVSRKCCG